MLEHRRSAGPLLRIVRAVREMARGGDARIAAALRLRAPEGLFQPYGTTQDDRYPVIFGIVRDLLGDGPDRAILSYGCATGEEVAALRGYFPQARIRGVDISASRIAIARRTLPDSQCATTDFAVAGSADGEPRDAYDAVFAMAVFRHNELVARPPDCSAILSFARFEAAIASVCASIRPGGYLIMRNANFRFADTASATAFEPILAAPNRAALYGPDNRLLPETAMLDGVFRKRAS